MRPRAVGGLEPDERDQRELVEWWHLSAWAIEPNPTRDRRIDWCVDKFLEEHPGIARKWVYVWCEAQLGRLTYGEPVVIPPHLEAPDRERPATVRGRRRGRTRG